MGRAHVAVTRAHVLSHRKPGLLQTRRASYHRPWLSAHGTPPHDPCHARPETCGTRLQVRAREERSCPTTRRWTATACCASCRPTTRNGTLRSGRDTAAPAWKRTARTPSAACTP